MSAGNGVNVIEDEAVANVEIGEAFFGGGVVIVLRENGAAVGAGAEEIRSGIDRFRESVSDAEGQAVAELFIEL